MLEKRGANARDEAGRWSPGGGSLEVGETIIEAVKREVREEFCVTPTEIEMMGYRDVMRDVDGVKTHWVLFDFRARVNRDEVKIGEPDMTDEIIWVKIKDIPEPMHSQFPAYLVKYKAELV